MHKWEFLQLKLVKTLKTKQRFESCKTDDNMQLQLLTLLSLGKPMRMDFGQIIWIILYHRITTVIPIRERL